MGRQWLTARRPGVVRLGCVALPLAVAAMPAMAQPQPDPNLPPDHGSLELVPGQALEPYTMTVGAGGEVDAWAAGDGCFGMIGAAPDVGLYFGAGGTRLVIGAYSDDDLTIVVNAPDGSWHCNDDYAGLNPGVAFDNPAPGRYAIWLGAFDGTPQAELVLTELEMEGVAPSPDFSLPPVYDTVALEAGFMPDPYVVSVVAGGPADPYKVSPMCSGGVTEAPTFDLNYTARAGTPLIIGARGAGDTTLVINAPDGQWYCNDDLNGLNPGVVFDNPQSGLYDIWVGAYFDTVDAELVITEVESVVAGVPPDLSLEPIHGTVSLAAGFAPDPHVVGVVAGGPANASQASTFCNGWVTEAPTLDLVYTAAEGVPLVIGARSQGDTTIVVNAPDGEWYCNDDFTDFDPGVVFDTPQDGLYDIWVGSFGDERIDAELVISAVVPEGAQEIAPDLALPPLYGTVSLEAGFAPSPYVTNVIAGGPAAAWLASPECVGYVPVEPTLDLVYTPAEGVSLTIGASSPTEDTTILVNAPDGGWYCNDDFDELNPAVVFDAPAEGLYDIWVGTFYGEPEVELVISESGGAAAPGGDTGREGGGSSLFGGGSGSDDEGEGDDGDEGRQRR